MIFYFFMEFSSCLDSFISCAHGVCFHVDLETALVSKGCQESASKGEMKSSFFSIQARL